MNIIESNNLEVINNRLRVVEGESSGYRIIEFDISEIETYVISTIQWRPTSENIQMESSLSLDGGNTFLDWVICDEAREIPQFYRNIDLSNAKLRIKQSILDPNAYLETFYINFNMHARPRQEKPENLTLKDDYVSSLPFDEQLKVTPYRINTGSDDHVRTYYRIIEDESGRIYSVDTMDINSSDDLTEDDLNSQNISLVPIVRTSMLPFKTYQWQARHEGRKFGKTEWSDKTNFSFNYFFSYRYVLFTESVEWIIPNDVYFIDVINIKDREIEYIKRHEKVEPGSTISVDEQTFVKIYYTVPATDNKLYVESDYVEDDYVVDFQNERVELDKYMEDDYVEDEYVYTFQ